MIIEAARALRDKIVLLTQVNSSKSVKPNKKKRSQSKQRLLAEIEELEPLLDSAEERTDALESLVASVIAKPSKLPKRTG